MLTALKPHHDDLPRQVLAAPPANPEPGLWPAAGGAPAAGATGAAVGELTRYLYDQIVAGNRIAVRELVHEDFLLAGATEHLDREPWLTHMLDEVRWISIDVDVISVDAAAPDALVSTSRVTYRARHDDYDCPAIDGSWRVIDVWMRQGVNWLLLSRTSFSV